MSNSIEHHAVAIAAAQDALAAFDASFDYGNMTPETRRDHAAHRRVVAEAMRAATADGYAMPQILSAIAAVKGGDVPVETVAAVPALADRLGVPAVVTHMTAQRTAGSLGIGWGPTIPAADWERIEAAVAARYADR